MTYVHSHANTFIRTSMLLSNDIVMMPMIAFKEK